jgi:undecaprenyl-diphosphatase
MSTRRSHDVNRISGTHRLVCLSRIYLGAHWLTDVLAGIALGAAWSSSLLAVTWIQDRAASPDEPPAAAPSPGSVQSE